jgi:hypothetical protein
MKITVAIRHLTKFVENADNYTFEDVYAREAVDQFVNRWENTLDALAEANPELLVIELMDALKKKKF